MGIDRPGGPEAGAENVERTQAQDCPPALPPDRPGQPGFPSRMVSRQAAREAALAAQAEKEARQSGPQETGTKQRELPKQQTESASAGAADAERDTQLEAEDANTAEQPSENEPASEEERESKSAEGTRPGTTLDAQTTETPPEAPEMEPGATDDAEQTDRGGSVRLEGERDYVVDDPSSRGRTITDIDHIEGGVLWEEKSATIASDTQRWTGKHIDKKFASYLDARQHLAGYEQAPIGFRFTSSGVDPEFRNAVESAVERLRNAHRDVRILLEWS
ncbi:hypothetical protein [Spirillospora sp. NPDC048819]|uniref:hypothetical protein n=1 Tax=Spirillospora sp. NPDC048819 TaxID=3155268 RepID=UPI0033EB26D1